MATPATAKNPLSRKKFDQIFAYGLNIYASAETIPAYIVRLELCAYVKPRRKPRLRMRKSPATATCRNGNNGTQVESHLDYVSLGLRISVVKDYVRMCRTLLGIGVDCNSALVTHDDTFGALSKSPRYNAESILVLIRKDSVFAAAAGLRRCAFQVEAKASHHLSGRATSIFDDIAIILHTDSTHDHATWLFGIRSMTASEIFASVITILEKFFHIGFVSVGFERARFTTPLSLA